MCKNRYTGDLGTMPLNFDKKRLSFSPAPKQIVEKTEVLAEKPEDELDENEPKSLESIIMR